MAKKTTPKKNRGTTVKKKSSKSGTPNPRQKTPTSDTRKKTIRKHHKQHNFKATLAISFLFAVIIAGLFVITNWPIPANSNVPIAINTAPVQTIKQPIAQSSTSSYQEEIIAPIIAPPEPVNAPTDTTNQPAQHTIDKVAIIMDDLGISLKHGEEALQLQLPITFAIIPDEPHSTYIMNLAHQQQHEIIIHIPMEPVSYPRNDPGHMGLFVSQNEAQIRQRIQKMIELVPYAVGCNNHMGSEFTQHTDKIDIFLDEIKQAQLFFVDSLTIAKSVAYAEARRLDIPTAKRNIFLDNERDVDKILLQLDKLVQLAHSHHNAVGICHPYPETITALAQFSMTSNTLNVELVPVSQLLH